MSAIITEKSLQWVNELSNPEVQEALTTLVQKLPQIKDAVVKMEQGLGMVTALAEDSQTINNIAEPLSHISKIALNKDNLDALLSLVEKLPRITQAVEMLEKVTPLFDLVTKKENIVSAVEVAGIIAAPVTERVQEGLSMAKEAKARAEQNRQDVGLFGLLRILKDPTVQDSLKFVQAFLEVLSEKKPYEPYAKK
ncbi:DUF1641 domain-containing protein [Ammoniphilus sp. CFH 90114]|uniref:DUF1641 domain-containing protein n=1 Tax=Ammoniphilus sp. CFH 90114 TaxID=2493665 RepID=UPI00100E3B09|nr:DUF1641 domain-containing protein [Ammoniphilus sp. CFH 90114]RXT04546.1 DUF1641 domain-containing protein [Ammoniphilus sp. CFH 90114]